MLKVSMMIKQTCLASACALSLVLTGCVGAIPNPLPVQPKWSTQEKKTSAHHWDVLASDVASQTIKVVESHQAVWKRPIHIQDKFSATAFDVAFRNMLITQLVA